MIAAERCARLHSERAVTVTKPTESRRHARPDLLETNNVSRAQPDHEPDAGARAALGEGPAPVGRGTGSAGIRRTMP